MTLFEEKLKILKTLLQEDENIQAYQAIEEKIRQVPELTQMVHDMKAYQQDAVLFQKIEKPQAQKQADQNAKQMSEVLNELPIVQDYRSKMQDASDLLQYVTKTLEERINEELNNDK
ncbi:YlbF family regulator [Streptococcus macacae]|uniref:PF06133 family protein n=1 Tax=Streptococcus macacae NCTC 11558 TaxID=764298 RepID=G5JWZ9_9STRE|nr:YlbF family regulator [Streptococcus macacae]EHJ52131.1 hypothetical protein STRMA_1542 [Streptococcus macacae NCTC 11558]SUN79475.1 membrane protein [Streptococcus macacae NCTC 11558]